MMTKPHPMPMHLAPDEQTGVCGRQVRSAARYATRARILLEQPERERCAMCACVARTMMACGTTCVVPGCDINCEVCDGYGYTQEED